VTLLTRRPVLIGLAATAVAVAAGIALDIPTLFRRRATGPYANLVNTVEDPDSAAVVGRAILGRVPLTGRLLEQSASFARDRLAKETLEETVTVDAAHNFLVEADGWVLPITLGTLCILATQSEKA
jgi:hypothetical protein